MYALRAGVGNTLDAVVLGVSVLLYGAGTTCAEYTTPQYELSTLVAEANSLPARYNCSVDFEGELIISGFRNFEDNSETDSVFNAFTDAGGIYALALAQDDPDDSEVVSKKNCSTITVEWLRINGYRPDRVQIWVPSNASRDTASNNSDNSDNVSAEVLKNSENAKINARAATPMFLDYSTSHTTSNCPIGPNTMYTTLSTIYNPCGNRVELHNSDYMCTYQATICQHHAGPRRGGCKRRILLPGATRPCFRSAACSYKADIYTCTPRPPTGCGLRCKAVTVSQLV